MAFAVRELDNLLVAIVIAAGGKLEIKPEHMREAAGAMVKITRNAQDVTTIEVKR